MTEEMRHVLKALHAMRFNLEDEKATQAQMWDRLRGYFPGRVEREALVNGGRIDFLVADSHDPYVATGIEVKLKGQSADIIRQLKSYAATPMMTGLVLASAKALCLPGMINGKPAAVLDLGRAWL